MLLRSVLWCFTFHLCSGDFDRSLPFPPLERGDGIDDLLLSKPRTLSIVSSSCFSCKAGQGRDLAVPSATGVACCPPVSGFPSFSTSALTCKYPAGIHTLWLHSSSSFRFCLRRVISSWNSSISFQTKTIFICSMLSLFLRIFDCDRQSQVSALDLLELSFSLPL